MLAEWRLLNDGINEARYHFAFEEALVRLVDEGHTPPTLRLRRVKPSVFVGVYQNTWSEVNVEYCKAHDIQIVRRANGGGAVYHEMGSFCFSAFFKRELFPQSEEELYRLFASPVIQTCADYGVVAHFHGRNDVLVGERKIYGSAQLSWYGAFVQSGTFLVNIDFDVMEQALTPPVLKFSGKSARSIHERVTSLSNEVSRELDTNEVMNRFTYNAELALGIRLIPGELTSLEQKVAKELYDEKYSTDEWNFGSQVEYQVVLADRSNDGVISLSANMCGEIIKEIKINGDILLSDRSSLENLGNSLTGSTLINAQSIVEKSTLSISIQKTLFRLLNRLTQEVAAITKNQSKEKLS